MVESEEKNQDKQEGHEGQENEHCKIVQRCETTRRVDIPIQLPDARGGTSNGVQKLQLLQRWKQSELEKIMI
jgi:hypothetical protein